MSEFSYEESNGPASEAVDAAKVEETNVAGGVHQVGMEQWRAGVEQWKILKPPFYSREMNHALVLVMELREEKLLK